MANVSPDLTALPQDVQDTLSNLVKPKFNAYFAFTSPAMCVRSIHGRSADGTTFYTYPDDSMISDLTVVGDRGVSEWTFTGTRTDGTHVEVHGCDLFTFRGGKIALKNSYRKNRPPLGTHAR